MSYTINAYVFAHVITALIALISIFLVAKRRQNRGGMTLLFLFVVVVWWSTSAALEAAATQRSLKILWSQFVYVGAFLTPPLFLLFSLQYTKRRLKMTQARIFLLFLIPVVMILMAFTNDFHGLVWTGYTPGPPGTNSLIYEHGPFFWLGTTYSFGTALFGSLTLFAFSVRSQAVYKRQNRLILLASLFPISGGILYVSGLNPFPGLDLIPSTFMFTGLALVISISREKLLTLNPISHEFLIDNFEDAIVVIDQNLRIVDMNQAAEQFLNVQRSKNIGKAIEEIVKFWEQIHPHLDTRQHAKLEIALEAGREKFLQINISTLQLFPNEFLGWMLTFEDITRRKNAELELQRVNEKLERQLIDIQNLQSKLREQAVRDAMTGTFNRGYLDDLLEREVARAKRNSHPLSVLMIDLDNFKRINDTYGHKAGDQVIKTVGKMLLQETRASDCVCRYGGDEFVVVMPEMSEKDAFARAEYWRHAIRAKHVIFQKTTIAPTISIGIATYPDGEKDPAALIDAADRALYRAKDAGRDCVRVYTAG